MMTRADRLSWGDCSWKFVARFCSGLSRVFLIIFCWNERWFWFCSWGLHLVLENLFWVRFRRHRKRWCSSNRVFPSYCNPPMGLLCIFLPICGVFGPCFISWVVSSWIKSLPVLCRICFRLTFHSGFRFLCSCPRRVCKWTSDLAVVVSVHLLIVYRFRLSRQCVSYFYVWLIFRFPCVSVSSILWRWSSKTWLVWRWAYLWAVLYFEGGCSCK
jgi:hypothetical protein